MVARRQTSIKVDPIAWDSAKEIFKEYNLSVTDAINIFLNRVRLERGLPFDLKIPNDKTLQAMRDADNNIGETITYDEFIKESGLDVRTLQR
jgi:DNA-damage-inducible protein J